MAHELFQRVRAASPDEQYGLPGVVRAHDDDVASFEPELWDRGRNKESLAGRLHGKTPSVGRHIRRAGLAMARP